MNEKLKSLASKIVILILGVLAIGSAVVAYSGSAQVEIETCDGCLFGASQSEELGASGTRFPNGISADTTSPVAGQVRGTTLTVTGLSTLGDVYAKVTDANIATTSTLDATYSGTTYYLTGGPFSITLPATSSAIIGTTYKFVVASDLLVTSTIVTASSENAMEGSLIVAGAVVGCEAEDTLTIGAGLEGIGDYVELTWQGTYWMIGDSGFQVAASLTCTAT